ncbi:unnamed protein product, partial [Hapterophycus canaliculatus]
LEGGRRIDEEGTMVLPKVIRASWEARHVQPDGNCMWRSCSLSFFGTDCFWPQLKLASLAFAAANVSWMCLLVPEGKVDHDIFAEHSKDAYVTQVDGSIKFVEANLCRDDMFMASIARLCNPGAFAGPIACVAVSETLGVRVNMMHPMDMKASKSMEKGLVKDAAGQEEVQHDTPNIDDTTNHFAAVVAKGCPELLCPTYLIAPRQRAADDASGKEDYDKRVLACKERQVDRERQAERPQPGGDQMAPADPTTSGSVAVAAVVVLVVVLELLRTQREDNVSIKRRGKAQGVGILFVAKQGRERQLPALCGPFPQPPIPLLVLVLILVCRSARCIQRLLRGIVAAAAACAVASTTMVIAALKAASTQFASTSSGGSVLEPAGAVVPDVSWGFNASSEDDGQWTGCLRLDGVDHASPTSSRDEETGCEGSRVSSVSPKRRGRSGSRRGRRGRRSWRLRSASKGRRGIGYGARGGLPASGRAAASCPWTADDEWINPHFFRRCTSKHGRQRPGGCSDPSSDGGSRANG